MSKDLKDKAIDIKGKKYVLVADRIVYFNDTYPNGAISSTLVSSLDSPQIVIQTTVCPDVDKPSRVFTGYSQATVGDGYINKTAALENAETSAVGRALAMMGIGVIDSVASVDEINKAKQPPTVINPAIQKLRQQIQAEFTRLGIDDIDEIKSWLVDVTGKDHIESVGQAEIALKALQDQ